MNKRRASIKDITERFRCLDSNDRAEFLEELQSDPRKGVAQLIARHQKQLKQERFEQLRLQALSEFEQSFRKASTAVIAGIDEVGRGPLAGPVVAACVIMDTKTLLPGINDSKKLSIGKRESLYEEILKRCIGYGVGFADNNEIDSLHIHRATYLAMQRAYVQMNTECNLILVDGNAIIPDLKGVDQKAIVQGDAKSYSIACASIIAKVYRDRWMDRYATQYPEYGFERNKGYGTSEHMAALHTYGPSKIHRRSFIHL